MYSAGPRVYFPYNNNNLILFYYHLRTAMLHEIIWYFVVKGLLRFGSV